VYDARDPSHLGAHMLILSLICLATSFAREHFNLAAIRSQIIFLSIGLGLYALPTTLIYGTSGGSEFWVLLWRWALPSVIYTSILSAAVLMLVAGRRLKSHHQADY
jgi:cell shape-determining protein MreD